MRTCKNCGEVGHNRRTCTNPTVAPSTPPTSSGRTCGNCGETGHNARTCQNAKVSTPSTTSSGRKCGKCGEIGHNARTCGTSTTSPAATPTPAPMPTGTKETVIADPQGIVTPPNVSQPTVQDTVYGVDVSGMKVIDKVNALGDVVKQYLTKKDTYIFFPEVNITRQEQFEKTLEKIGEMVSSRNNDNGMKLVFKHKIVNREKKVVPLYMERFAERNLLPGAFKENDKWYWEIITYMVEHSEFEDPKFELIGTLVNQEGWDKNRNKWEFITKFYYRDDYLAFDGNQKRAAQYTPVGPALEKIVAPQYRRLQTIFAKRSTNYGNTNVDLKNGQAPDAPKRYMGNCICTKCNPEGDNRWRRAVFVYMATEDIKGFKLGQLGSEKGTMDINKYDIITLGDGCEYVVNPIDIELVASLYGSSRVKSVKQYQWQNPFSIFGYNFKEMDIRSYLKRVFAFYGKKMEAVLKTLEKRGVKFFQIPDTFITQSGITYKACNPYALDYLVDKMQNASYNSERRKYDKELRKNQKKIYESIFPQPYQRGQNRGKTPPAKGIFGDKSSFLLKARLFEQDGKYWLQSATAKTSGIDDFMEAYEDKKDDPDFFIEELQPIFNEDGLPMIDEDGEPEEEFVKLPNPAKLKELFALDGGIIEVWNPDDVEDEVLDAIEYIESLDADNLPDILRKYFRANEILNPQAQLEQLNAVSDLKTSRVDAIRMWQIWTISQLEERRQKSYYTYISEQKQRMESRLGMSLQRIPFRMLDAQQKEVIEYLDDNSYLFRNAHSQGVISDSDYQYIQNLQKGITDELVVGKRGDERVLYIEDGKSIDYTLIENAKNSIQKLREENAELSKAGRSFKNNIMGIYRDTEGEYVNDYSLPRKRATIPSMGENYTNEEILNVLGIDSSMLPSADKIQRMLNVANLSNIVGVDSNGLITQLPMGYRMRMKLKNYFEQKQLANIGVGQAPTVSPVAPIPTTTPTMPSFTRTEMMQLERDVEVENKGYIPESTTTELKGYIFNIFDKAYNAPAWASGLKSNGRVKYVTMITAGNDDSDLDYYFVNFPYPVSELERRGANYKVGMPIAISDYTMKNEQPFRNRKQRNCYVRFGGLRKER